MKFHDISLKYRIRYFFEDLLERFSLLFSFVMLLLIGLIFIPIKLLSFDAECVFKLQRKLMNYFFSKILKIIGYGRYDF